MHNQHHHIHGHKRRQTHSSSPERRAEDQSYESGEEGGEERRRDHGGRRSGARRRSLCRLGGSDDRENGEDHRCESYDRSVCASHCRIPSFFLLLLPLRLGFCDLREGGKRIFCADEVERLWRVECLYRERKGKKSFGQVGQVGLPARLTGWRKAEQQLV